MRIEISSIVVGIIVALGVYFLFKWANKARNEKERRQSEKSRQERLSEENVLRTQLEFESHLDEDADLPDGIRWRQAYIYRNLMREWFGRLIAIHRYDESISEKIRSDWLRYIVLLQHAATSNFLNSETSNDEKRYTYGQRAWEERQQHVAIEDAFAAAVGKDAGDELRRIRKAPHHAFDRSGRKPLAPPGYKYVPVSLHPYDEELKPD